ncbi:hypothetical protein [Methylobacterium aerolatum]|uniref:Uncharacterized protein n=1 Tax=Methylobacterium aerolatum TaxID=418708 RepID=A0ABU0I154_9HYPH|nr:hypothetical protein [Methylobacterium aerolatum]MDQ0448323.1 hypothetical protein [Methylobacterium aerolatum]
MRLYDRDGRKAEGQLRASIPYVVNARESFTSVGPLTKIESFVSSTMTLITSNFDAATVKVTQIDAQVTHCFQSAKNYITLADQN